MKIRSLTLSICISAIVATSAFAQATRTWVSGVGDDVNPCSRTAPCKTFAGAISKTAAGGQISVLDPGGFGSVTITVALMVGIFAIVTTPDHGWGSLHTIGLCAASIGLIAVFVTLQARLANPIMPLRILRVQGLVSTSLVRGLLATGLFSTFFLGALYLERVRGYSALRTGVAFLPLSLIVGALSAGVTARLMARFGARAVMLPGLVLTGLGLLLMSRVGEHSSYFPGMFFALLILGLGAGTAFIPLLAIAMAHVPSSDAGLASGIVNVSMQMSGAIGLAVLGTVSTDHARSLVADGQSLPSALTSGYQLAFLVGAACVALGLVLALLLLRPPPAPVPAAQTALADSAS